MVSLSALWLPILLSAIAVFVVSSLVHMVLTYHRRDYDKLPDEDAFMAYLGEEGIGPGNYVFPCAMTAEERKDPKVMEKMTNGPAGFMTVVNGFQMGKSMMSWLIVCLVISFFVAYIATLCLQAGAEFKQIFRVVSTVALLGYAGASSTESIWMGRRWSTTFRHIFDGVLFALATGCVFGWLWP